MNFKDKLRTALFSIIGPKNVDSLRYLKFRYKFGKFLKYKDGITFTKRFSEFYEPEMALIPKISRNPQVIIDVGANYGTYSFFLSKLYPESKIFAFEPSTRTFDIFRKIIKNFNLKNVIPIKKGLGSKEERKEIVMPAHYTILAYISEKNTKRKSTDLIEDIKITTLDNFVKRNNLKNVDFIKCDVEGFELEVFRGAKNTIKKFKPVVFVEVEERHTNKYGINPNDVLKFFKKLGYFCYSTKNDKIVRTDKIKKEIPLYIFSSKKLKIPISQLF